MIIEFAEGKMVIKHSSGVTDVYTKEDIQKIKTNFEQDLLRLKVEIARQDVYLNSMSETKPRLLARMAKRLHIV